MISMLPGFSAVAADYFVDSKSGDDEHTGLSELQAWRSLQHVDEQIFQAGDRILFKCGSQYSGQLAPHGSGAADHPIRIDEYGVGAPPRLDGEGRTTDALVLRNVEFWEVCNLEITNQGAEREPWRTGVHVIAQDFGPMRHIHLENLFVHEVNGDLHKSQEGCGIYFETRGFGTYFDDFLVEDCHLQRTDRNGIGQRNGGRTHSRHVVIRGNLLEDIGGDCIKAWGSDAPLVEHNIVRGGRMRCDESEAAAGIWPFDCNDALIQYNEVSGMKGTRDGQAFDADYACRRSIFQYNYSHGNDGGFMLICSPGRSFNEDAVIRYNISQGDGVNSARVFQFGGKSTNTLVYNNTIYIGAQQDVPLLSFNEWDGGRADGAKFFNNLFYVEGRTSYRWNSETNTVFAHNVFYGHHAEIPPDPFADKNRPALARAGSGGEGLRSLEGYKPDDAASFPRGQIVPNNGGRDFFGNPVSSDRPPCIGAVEARQ